MPTRNQGHVEIKKENGTIRVNTIAENGRELATDMHANRGNALINIKAVLNCFGGESIKVVDYTQEPAATFVLYHDGAQQPLPTKEAGDDVTPIGPTLG